MKAKTSIFNKSLNKEKCISFLIRYGYFIHIDGEDTLIIRKAGTDFVTSGEKYPKELSILFNTFETIISLRYDTFNPFDTDALQEELILLSNRITTNLNHLV